MNLRQYINNNLCNEVKIEAIVKVAEKIGIYIDIDYADGRYHLIDLFSPREETIRGRHNAAKKGIYIHMMNKGMDDGFSSITGEICASELGDWFLTRGKGTVGVLLSGTPTASFNHDCWSVIDSDGTRRATRPYDHYCSHRTEHWLIPSQCKIIGFVGEEGTPIDTLNSTNMEEWQDFSDVMENDDIDLFE